MTHTQGHWNIEKGAHFMAIRTEDEVIANMREIGGFFNQKNAALIAASPDLLDALLIALPFVEDLEADEGYKAGAVKKAVATIRAAIAKATGE